MVVPACAVIETYLQMVCCLGDVRADIVSSRNHIIYKITRHPDGKLWAMRMVNPSSYRKNDWISVTGEYLILCELSKLGLGPKVYSFGIPSLPLQPFILQEYVDHTVSFNRLPLKPENLAAVSQAIALINQQDISPERFPFMEKYVKRGYHHQNFVWHYRLADSMRRSPRRDVFLWTMRILPVARQAWGKLKKAAKRNMTEKYSFHHDGAHTGNIFLRPDGKIIFLDWDKVSWRNDPSFTLVRFATSLRKNGTVTEDETKILLSSYLAVSSIGSLPLLFHFRYLERLVSDLVWVLWDYTRRGGTKPLEDATNIAERYEYVKKLVQTY